jgi:hypothetical protein
MKCIICDKRAYSVVDGFSFCKLHRSEWKMGYGKSIMQMKMDEEAIKFAKNTINVIWGVAPVYSSKK